MSMTQTEVRELLNRAGGADYLDINPHLACDPDLIRSGIDLYATAEYDTPPLWGVGRTGLYVTEGGHWDVARYRGSDEEPLFAIEDLLQIDDIPTSHSHWRPA